MRTAEYASILKQPEYDGQKIMVLSVGLDLRPKRVFL